MKTVLKISTVLSWFNLIVWGFIVLMVVLSALASQQLAFLGISFMFCVIVLHSYAALQLQKSIRNPDKPLSGQTPVGIRFIGAIAAFFGIAFFANGFALLQNPHESLQMMESQFPQAKGVVTQDAMRLAGGFTLFCGICIVLNVLLNFRLMRWYYFMKGMM